MTSNERLNVWYGESLVGLIGCDATGTMGFKYHETWVDNGFAISYQLPLSNEEYNSQEGKAHRFFANLLPEGNARRHVVRNLKITDSDFELLKAIGGESAGALSILPEDLYPHAEGSYKKLSEEELINIVYRKGNIASFVSENERPRLSLAGAQDKCPIFYDGNNFFLPQDASPSTHIIKFQVEGYRHILAYEYLLTQLAKTVGLPVVDCDLIQLAGDYFLLVKRYDRIKMNNKIHRLHQEDFCQAFGLSYANKYEQWGGPTVQKCYSLTQKISTNSIEDSDNLIKWQIFNFMAGNSDGHAKNLAFIYVDKFSQKLAPFYDLVCTQAVARIDTKLAMSVAGAFQPGMVEWKHWQQLAAQCDVTETYLSRLLEKTATDLLENISTIIESFENLYGEYPALQRVKQVVMKQCKKIAQQI